MESMGVMSDGELINSFCGFFSNNEEAEFMLQLLGNFSYTSEQQQPQQHQDEYPSLGNMSTPVTANYYPNHHHDEAETNDGGMMMRMPDNSYFCADISYPHYENMSQVGNYSFNGNGDHVYMQNNSYHDDHDNYYVSDANAPILMSNNLSMDYVMVEDQEHVHGLTTNNFFPGHVVEETNNTCLNEEMSNESSLEAVDLHDQRFEAKAKSEIEEPAISTVEDKSNVELIGNCKKRTRVPRDNQKNKRNVRSKKSKKQSPSSNDEEERQCSSGCSSEEDSNGSQEEPKESSVLNMNGKARASRGSATDPQSLYARKRRERINERLKTLQNLVPNGTKVDISTMLEEAVDYVKFLQLQIKLLSSDDLWMYAPIAYNGMNIGALDHINKISQKQ
ncbi:hypothetical protein C5167_024507 [Papaver somniferum]|uniref:BHLH domain-containing protein n=1 Tax=Papaver somniferum TaxID=3469 RepID=A0A4Y7JQC7_PAPSO|nr:transcription factor bHLH84-like [Papaver somniferum]RZC62756.1 hypothetical protein C5167_024507 [Papaver somniferum]